MNIAQLKRVLGVKPNEKLPSYTLLGGYPRIYFDKENNILCPKCANSLIDNEWGPVEVDFWCEGPTICCNECGEGIKPSYGNPELEV